MFGCFCVVCCYIGVSIPSRWTMTSSLSGRFLLMSLSGSGVFLQVSTVAIRSFLSLYSCGTFLWMVSLPGSHVLLLFA